MLVDATDVYAVRANPRRLVLATGHETGDEHVMHEYDDYVIVELSGQAPA